MNQVELIQALPKAELHVHIEGTFEPELMFAIAQRNQIQIPYKSVEEVKQAYNFHLCTRQISQNPYPIRVLPS
ncbi:hypothetical protein V3D02_18625, partial [Acinetobacter baumannii]